MNCTGRDRSEDHLSRLLVQALKPGLRVFECETLNAEAFPELLDEPLTPVTSFFLRNNGQLPHSSVHDRDRWTITVDGEVQQCRTWSVSELRNTFEVVTVTAVLECAGNGRSGFFPPTNGLQWTNGAVGCARWTGVRLADVLQKTGLKQSAVYTGHHSPDVQTDGSGRAALSRGLPIAKALALETLLAFRMNDEPLPLLHGGPLRVVAPGFPGSAWQKWLSRIEVRDREHDGVGMTGTDYRLPKLSIAPGQAIDQTKFAVITDVPVKSLITSPTEGFSVSVDECLRVRGFAWSGHTPVASVALSIDGGETWQQARLELPREYFAWRRFTATLRPRAVGPVILLARATDQRGRVQPLESAPWNPRGYCNNAVHRIGGFVNAASAVNQGGVNMLRSSARHYTKAQPAAERSAATSQR